MQHIASGIAFRRRSFGAASGGGGHCGRGVHGEEALRCGRQSSVRTFLLFGLGVSFEKCLNEVN